MRLFFAVAFCLSSVCASAQTNSNPPGGGSPGGSSGQVQFNNAGAFGGDAGLTYITQGQLTIVNASANTTPLTISGQSLTGSDTSPGINYSGTWNTSAGPTAIRVAITNTASTAGNLINLLAGAGGVTSEFSVASSGTVTSAGSINGTNLFAAATNTVGWAGRGLMSSPTAGSVKFGATDTAAPVAQTTGVQGVVAGTTNGSGQNWTINGSISTGSGTGGDVIFQTAGTGAGATTQNAFVAAMTLKGATQAILMPALASQSTATTGTVCWTTGGNLTVDTTVACLASLEELKDKHGPIIGAMEEIGKLEPFWYSWKEGTPERAGDAREQPGLGAHQVESVDPRLAGYGTDGKLSGVRYAQMVALLIAGMKELKADNDNLRAEVRQLEHVRRHRR